MTNVDSFIHWQLLKKSSNDFFLKQLRLINLPFNYLPRGFFSSEWILRSNETQAVQLIYIFLIQGLIFSSFFYRKIGQLTDKLNDFTENVKHECLKRNNGKSVCSVLTNVVDLELQQLKVLNSEENELAQKRLGVKESQRRNLCAKTYLRKSIGAGILLQRRHQNIEVP